MLFVHAVKILHTHPALISSHHSKHTSIICQADVLHSSCTICEFQLAKDAPFTGEIVLVIAPVHVSATYSRLLTSINPDRLLTIEGRGPPQA
ncbi:MAG TPA: hypothetical protein VGE79_02835 [Niastella sp.]